DGHPVALAEPAVGVRQQHEAGARDAQPAVGGKEVGAVLEDRDGGKSLARAQAQRVLRPRLRRARRILRPPGVALRAKKPCRRARTRLLGWKVRFIVLVLENLSCGACAPTKRATRWGRPDMAARLVGCARQVKMAGGVDASRLDTPGRPVITCDSPAGGRAW